MFSLVSTAPGFSSFLWDDQSLSFPFFFRGQVPLWRWSAGFGVNPHFRVRSLFFTPRGNLPSLSPSADNGPQASEAADWYRFGGPFFPATWNRPFFFCDRFPAGRYGSGFDNGGFFSAGRIFFFLSGTRRTFFFLATCRSRLHTRQPRFFPGGPGWVPFPPLPDRFGALFWAQNPFATLLPGVSAIP